VEFKDYYNIMGINREATQDDIKRAYRKLARKYHPDVSKESNAEARFKEIGEAYEVLKDPEKRAAYDQLGTNWQSGQEFQPPPGWNQGFEFHGGGFTQADASQFSSFFEALFGGGFATNRKQREYGFNVRGEDTHAKILVDLEDAYHGSIRTITLQHTELGPDGRPQIKTRTLNVRIPKGIHQGQLIRLAGQGSPGIGKNNAGDLYLEVGFQPHSYYKVEGKDVFLELPVTPWEIVLGKTIKAPTPAGIVDLKIPPGTQTGRKLRLKGRGIPGNPPGDLYIILQIVLPSADTEQARLLYQEMEQKLAFNPRTRLGV
jgi:curved DNA-binding protein